MRSVAAMVACAALSGGLMQAAASPTAAASDGAAESPGPGGSPEAILGKGWASSGDRAVAGAADAGGYRITVADSAKAYEWKTSAVLSEPGVTADLWIGNQCVMDREHVAVVYAPRVFTNKPDLMRGGAFAAVVDLNTGRTKKLPFTVSLAYFDPTCNPNTKTALFSAFRDDRTRLVAVDVSGAVKADTTAQGQVTSAVPVRDGVVAARGDRLVHVSRPGVVRDLAESDSAPFDIRVTGRGDIAFLDHRGGTAQAHLWRGHGRPLPLGAGKLGDLALKQGGTSTVFLTGHPVGKRRLDGTGVSPLAVSADTDVSSEGRLAVDPILSPAVRAGLERIKGAGQGFTKAEPSPRDHDALSPRTGGSEPLSVTATVSATGQKITRTAQGQDGGSGNATASPSRASSGLRGSGPPLLPTTASSLATDPVDTDRWCSVPRNDVNSQTLQPTPNQVEWAVDMAVRGELRAGWITQGGWRSQIGLGAIDPQGLFPPPTLKGGGRIPAQVLLGVLAQESNLWQAEPGAIPGQMGSPLAAVAGFYGHKGADADSYWKIHWENSDCGYGVGQVTDGMRMAGHEKDGETSLPPAKQRAVALDYTVNIAASMYILADKWNELHTDGQKITVNNDDPAKPENWFAALWNYNLGFNAPSSAPDQPWGLGWYNNPANPMYPPDRKAFMDTSLDPEANKNAAHPERWPYEEKVMGWAAWSIDTGHSYSTDGKQDWPGETGFSSAGFRPAWWPSATERSLVKPPLNAFCNTNNNCDSKNPPHCDTEGCYTQYWYHYPNVTWKALCANTCGNESIKYQTLRSEPGRGYRLQYGTPECPGDVVAPAPAALPAESLVVASVPNGTQTWSACGPAKSAGDFRFTFNPDGNGLYEAKGDLHQIGGGYGGHFWYAHTRNDPHLGGSGGRMTINGTWTLGQNLGWARVLVHLPDTGAHTRQAAYVVRNADTSSPQRIVPQRGDRWVSLGVFRFTGTPQVELSNTTADGTADEDIAWGAVAFQPLAGKPANSIVTMGDSFASGEGASAPGGVDFFPESDYYDKLNGRFTDKCHRSRRAWSRQATLPGYVQSIGALDDSFDPRMDYHSVACSSARHYDILNRDQMGEGAQIESGYLDNTTTLVTLSVGGNDARFTDVFNECVWKSGLALCQDAEIGNKDPDTGAVVSGQTGPLKSWAPAWLHDQVRPRLTKTLNEIHRRAPYARIILMGYPHLLSMNGVCIPGIGTSEAPWLNELADTLNQEMSGAVSDAVAQTGASVVFADPRTEFEGKTICGDPETVHGIVKSGLSKADNFDEPAVGMASFHPKIEGARLYANVLERALN
ncbi:hypothetical protein [Streptomyces sp. NPDC050600]|uniref:hypothetical protein n=1 Tax=unclassified Streptomyces TaxID=2593676 RepID=UPI0034150B5A